MQAREKQTVRQQSAMWVEEKDLERCIVDALVDPFYLVLMHCQTGMPC